MSKFITLLQMEPMWDGNGMPLCNRDGRRLFELLAPLSYQSDLGFLVTAEKGFVSDLGSVPRIPLVYDSLGEIAQEPYVIHDVLYSKGILNRYLADNILREALELCGIPSWKANLIYLGVRAGGGSHWGPDMVKAA